MKFLATSLLFLANTTTVTANKWTSSKVKGDVPSTEDPKTTTRSLKVKSPSAAKAHRGTKAVVTNKGASPAKKTPKKKSKSVAPSEVPSFSPSLSPSDLCSNQNQIVKTVYEGLNFDMTSFSEEVCGDEKPDGISCVDKAVTQISLRSSGGSSALTGTISSEIGCLSTLTSLDFYNNNLGGSIPSELAKLTSLESLIFLYNGLGETIPSELAQLTSLVHLDFASNSLDGSIPSELAKLTSLQSLKLDRNDLDGSIPSEVGKLTSLMRLNFADNNLDGSIPSELAELSSLKSLNLVWNDFSGIIPTELCDLSTTFFLSANKDICPGSCGSSECCDQCYSPPN